MHLYAICSSLLVKAGRWALLVAVLAAGVRAAEPNQELRRDFDLPAGPAEQTLASFSLYAQSPVIFPSKKLAGVHTKAIKGRYSDFEALELMLEDSPLKPVLGLTDGILKIEERPHERVVELPPFVVEEEYEEPSWIYAQLGPIEVISRCSEFTTQILIEHHFRLRQMLSALVPLEFQVKSDVPSLYVLYNESNQPGISREILDSVENTGEKGGSWRVRGMKNFRFWDRDSEATLCVLDERNFEQARMSLTPDYVRYTLEMRVPELPWWITEGIMETYRATVLESVPLANPPNYAWGRIVTAPIVVSPLQWVSEAETQEIKQHPRRKRTLLPMDVLFTSSIPTGESDEIARLRRAQSALFVRWAIDPGEKPSKKEALWNFVRKSSVEGASHKLFQECFGMDYTAAEQSLRSYLVKAVKQTFYVSSEIGHDPPRIDFIAANNDTVGRLKGRLERLGVTYVRQVYPALATKYEEQARRTLNRAYNKGSRGPELAAELGLCECDAGNDATAQPFLRAAADGKVARPRVYFELARIKYASLRREHPDDQLSATEITEVIDLLAVAAAQYPRLPEVYELMMEIWLRSRLELTATEFKLIDEGARLFPHRFRLIYAAALLNANHARWDIAQALLNQALRTFNGSAQQAKLQQLQVAIMNDLKPEVTQTRR